MSDTFPTRHSDDDPDFAQLRARAERVIRHVVGSRTQEDIEDLASESLLKFIRFQRGNSASEPEALVVTIARATAIDFIRRKRRWAHLLALRGDEWRVAGEREPAPDLDEDPVDRIRFAVLEYFDAENAACADLARHFFRGEEWSRLANDAGRTVEAVRKQWSRCLSVLRKAAADHPLFSYVRDWYEND